MKTGILYHNIKKMSRGENIEKLKSLLKSNSIYYYLVDIYEIKSNAFINHFFKRIKANNTDELLNTLNNIINIFGAQPYIVSILVSKYGYFIRGLYRDNNIIFEISIKEVKNEPV